MQWLKLNYYPFNDTVVKCADKYAVREYIEKKGYSDLLVPLVDHWEDAREIEWDKLPDKFVLKCNHGCAYNILCDDKNNFDKNNFMHRDNLYMIEKMTDVNVIATIAKGEDDINIDKELLESMFKED